VLLPSAIIKSYCTSTDLLLPDRYYAASSCASSS
jgi:hypothetical protein